jgi:CHAT domain-containing protein/tetratricopeptide (TPR) repeat protein
MSSIILFKEKTIRRVYTHGEHKPTECGLKMTAADIKQSLFFPSRIAAILLFSAVLTKGANAAPRLSEREAKELERGIRFYEATMRPNEAYKEEEELNDRSTDLFNLGRHAEARSTTLQMANSYKSKLKKLVDRHGADSPEIITVLVRYAYACIRADQKQEAIKHLQMAAGLIDKYRVAKVNTLKHIQSDAKVVKERLAEILDQEGRGEQAEHILGALVASAKTKEAKSKALLELYRNKKRNNNYTDAVEIARQYVASGGNRLILAEALERTELWDEAAKQYSLELGQLNNESLSGQIADLNYRLARCYVRVGQKKLALKCLRSSLASQEQQREQALFYPDTAEEDEFRPDGSPLKSSVGIPDNRYELEMVLLNPHEIANLIIKQKGAAQDAMLENATEMARAANDPVGAMKLADLKRIKKAEAEHEQQCPSSRRLTTKNCDSCAQIRNKRFNMEFSLTAWLFKARSRRAAVSNIEKIQEGLPVGTAIVEFFTYQDINMPKGSLKYAAVVIRGDKDSEVVLLPKASEVESCVQEFTSHSQEAAEKLRDMIWLPLEKHFEDVSRVIISPEALLNLVPFAALCDKGGRFVCEDKEIVYVASSRDLLVSTDFTLNRKLLAFGNPKVSGADVSKSEAKSALAPDLPGAGQEVEIIGKIATDLGWEVEAKVGVAASEPKLRSIAKASVVHCAMHALFASKDTPQDGTSRGMKLVETANRDVDGSKDLKKANGSGVLVLAGGEDAARKWLSGKIMESKENDGILTGKEAAELNLRGTWLTVLSACDTATIDIKGLRRGFMLAGSANLLMTLWPIEDSDTAKIMEDFYKKALLTGNAPLSLTQVQKEWLIKLRSERGVSAAIAAAGPFVIFTTGDPEEVIYAKKQLKQNIDNPSNNITKFQSALAKADAGDGYAQAVVSIYYGLGLDCQLDASKSKDYALRSAKQGNPLGIFRLAEMREAGETMDKNLDQARQLMQKAKSGLEKMGADPFALTSLAGIEGRENPSSPRIFELLTQAAEMGHQPAIKILSEKNQ